MVETAVGIFVLLAQRMSIKQLAASKRKPKSAHAKGYVDSATARSHVSTARVLKKAAGCQRRLNIEPPCRFKFEPGRVANS